VNVALISSSGQCGIHEYSLILRQGFEAIGHHARYIGVKNWDDADLFRKLSQIAPDDGVVIFEYEPGIFHLRALVRALAQMRLVRRKRVILSVHEIEPVKFPSYHHIQGRLDQPARFGGPLELVRLTWAAADVALHYFTTRVFLTLLGWMPHVVSVHSPKANENIGLMLANRSKIAHIPHVIKPQHGDPTALRAELGLPQDRFLFICPGFLFRRKRILETIEQLPSDTELLIVGLPSQYDPGYLEEIQTRLAQNPEKRVHLVHDYDNMEKYLLASDAAALYYRDAYQSGIACLALGAGKPCVFSDLPAFSDYREAGLFARTDLELGQAMQDIQHPDVYARLQAGAVRLRERFKPECVASQYVSALTNPSPIEASKSIKERA
jgi:hypothetical protein